MDWLSFFIGALVGWIVEWLIDLFYWRRKYQSCQEEKEALQARLNEAEKRLRTYQVKGGEPETKPRPTPADDVATQQVTIVPPFIDLDTDLAAPEGDMPDRGIDAFLDDLRARLPDIDLDASIDRLRARFPDLNVKTALHGLKVDFPGVDIDGAFAGLRAKFPHLDWDADADLEAPDMRLAVEPRRPDDLKLIEGIGPKISHLLQDDGILTFAQLAGTSIDRLEAILQAAGPNFQLADPATWPEQARLAADGAWDELRVLQDRLIGGQTRHR